MTSNNPLVSVIVPTYNSEKFIEACLLSIKNQTYKNIEVIVVDNNSIDRTKEIANKYADKVFNQGPERSAQRNYGVKESGGEYVLIIDSDMELSKNVVAACVNKARSVENINGVIIPEESFGEGFWAQCKKLERSFYVGVDWMEAARFFARDLYLQLGGYNEEMVSGEDWDLSQRLEEFGSLGRIDDYIYHNEDKISLVKTIKKKYYYAGKFTKYRDTNLNQEKIAKQIGVINRYKLYLSQPKKLFSNPLTGLGMLFMKFCEFSFGWAGYMMHIFFPMFLIANKIDDNVSIIVKQEDFDKKYINADPLVSVVIACKNNVNYINQSLDSVLKQSYKNIELIIVDNFSSDGTFEIAKKYTEKVFQLGPERSTQFNYGFKQSSGKLIYRIGAEFVLEPDVVEKCVAKINEGYDAVAVHNQSKGDSIWARVRYIERESYKNDNTIVAVRFMKRDVFESVGMFDESLVAGEDFDLHNRIVAAGYKWTHANAIEYHVGEPKNLFDVWKKFYYYGRTIRRYSVKNKNIAKSQLVFFRPSFKKINQELIKVPKLFAAFYFYLLVKHIAGFCGVLRGAPKYIK